MMRGGEMVLGERDGKGCVSARVGSGWAPGSPPPQPSALDPHQL